MCRNSMKKTTAQYTGVPRWNVRVLGFLADRKGNNLCPSACTVEARNDEVGVQMAYRCAGVSGLSKSHRESASLDAEFPAGPLQEFQDIRHVFGGHFRQAFLVGHADDDEVTPRFGVRPAVFGDEPAPFLFEDLFAVVLEVLWTEGALTVLGDRGDHLAVFFALCVANVHDLLGHVSPVLPDSYEPDEGVLMLILVVRLVVSPFHFTPCQ